MPSALVARLVFWLWFGAAFFVGQQLLLQRLPAFGIPFILVLLTLALLYAYLRFTAFRAWVDALDLRTLVLFHATRFVGIYFLVLYSRGQLPYAFAVPGGIGDIVVAALALVLVFVPLAEATHLRFIRIWNVVGLIDLTLVVVTAVRLNLESPWQMRALTYLPLSLLPTFLVPLLIVSHLVIFLRLARSPSAT
jgi:hypothetical protein